MVFINYKGTIAEPVYNEFGDIINEGEVVGITEVFYGYDRSYSWSV